MKMEPTIPRCRRMTKAGKHCGHRLIEVGDYWWCYRSDADPVTGLPGCTTHWPKSTVEAWPTENQP